MIHHDWKNIPAEQLNPKTTRKAVHTENMTIARLELQKGAVVPEHHHVNEQVATVEKGALKFFIEGREVILREGESLAIPANVPHAVEAIEDTAVLDIFAPRRDDWIAGDDAYLRR